GDLGETVVIDWGVAKDLRAGEDEAPAIILEARDGELTRAGQVVGTPAYMPPEQARSEPATPAADLYAVGALLYHACAGAPPYRARRPAGGAAPAARDGRARSPGRPGRDRRQGDGPRVRGPLRHRGRHGRRPARLPARRPGRGAALRRVGGRAPLARPAPPAP